MMSIEEQLKISEKARKEGDYVTIECGSKEHYELFNKVPKKLRKREKAAQSDIAVAVK